ncbi:2-oxoacid:acceptor oxidoreductase family protein [Myxococcota bacterium]|nr:2-oxoacid:acceptor oxidoreductase family protein [Myxococcota bacterium]
MSVFNIYLIGVGGQGIGLLSNILIRSIDRSGQKVIGVDTHGLAQRGGTVQSMVRVGEVFSALIPEGEAHLVVALEKNEALRGLTTFLRPGGTLVYYDTEWQPLATRMSGKTTQIKEGIAANGALLKAREIAVHIPELPDTRMQNMALLATIAHEGLVPGVTVEHFVQTIEETVPKKLLSHNLALFHQITR